MPNPKPGETWRDLRPMTDRREWRDEHRFRRCLTITTIDHTYVEGSSFWQEKRVRIGWTRMEYPPARKTRILRHVFDRRFVLTEENRDAT